MFRQFTNIHFYVVLLTDALLCMLSLALAILLRFEFSLVQLGHYFPLLAVVIIPMKIFSLFLFGLYRGMWRYTDIRDSWRLVQALVLAQSVSIAVFAMVLHFEGFSRAVFVIDLFLSFLATGGVRVCIRTYYLHRRHFSVSTLLRPGVYRKRRARLTRVIIVGAGDAGEKVLREIIENPKLTYEAVAFLDDLPSKHHLTVHGVPVLGTIDTLPEVAADLQADEVLIAIPSATGAQMRRVVATCKAAQVQYKTLPGIGELIKGQVSVRQFRNVQYEDLLGREPVRLFNANISSYLTDRVVMITGAGGSIGSELVRQIVPFEPKCILLYERTENNLYNIQMELEHDFNFKRYVTVLGKVQNFPLMNKIMALHRPQAVFHAAAYKHVPLVECNPWAAVFNNVLGSHVAMEVAHRNGVDRFVLVSTDKAVRPTNVMGASKRVAELLLQSRPPSDTHFMAVRFGNVVGSSGSVIPLFKKQIENGGPVTVTHPEMTRYFMTIPEATQLILQAGSMGHGREIFILKMGTPVRIADMARDLIRLSGKEPDVDIEIKYIGIRPGEKLYEEFITHEEDIVPTEHEEIMVLKPEVNAQVLDPEYRALLKGQLRELLLSAWRFDPVRIKEQFRAMVPEYVAKEERCVLTTPTGQVQSSADCGACVDPIQGCTNSQVH